MRTGLAVGVLVGSWMSAVMIWLAGSYPDGGLIAGLAAVIAVLLTAIVWLALLVVELAGRRAPLITAMTVAVVLVVVGSAFAARIELPLLARFALARPAFERVIAERGEAGPGAVCPRWIGTYRIGGCRTIGSDTYFTERDGGFLNSVGFVYLPEGQPTDPPTSTSITYGQLRGPWYWFVEAW